MNVVRAGLGITVKLNGCLSRQRTVATTDFKPFHSRSPEIRHPFEDEFGQFVWSPDLGLATDSVVAAPLYTLVNRRVAKELEERRQHARGNTKAIPRWYHFLLAHRRHCAGQLFTHNSTSSTPYGKTTTVRQQHRDLQDHAREREVATRTEALEEFPGGTDVTREFTDREGNKVPSRGRVCDFNDPY